MSSKPEPPIYSYWRTDKPKEEGFSHELVSIEYKVNAGNIDLDNLEQLMYPGIDTLYKAFYRNVEKMPDHKWLGTRVGDEYSWVTFKEVAYRARYLSYGYLALDLIPEVEAEGIKWRMMGI